MQEQDMDRFKFECHPLPEMDSLARTFWQVSFRRNIAYLLLFLRYLR